MQRIKPPHIVIAVVVIVVGAFIIPQVLADQPGARSSQGTTITETIGVVETNATAVFPVRLTEGAGAEHESSHMFEALAGLPGVGKATLDTETLELTVSYNDSQVSDGPIRTRLVESGYMQPTAEDATPTQLATDGSTQRIAVADDGTGFTPYLIRARAGVPIEIEFAPGTECRIGVKFPDLGIEQDISQGGLVELPALESGEYQIACSGDGHEGTLIVE